MQQPRKQFNFSIFAYFDFSIPLKLIFIYVFLLELHHKLFTFATRNLIKMKNIKRGSLEKALKKRVVTCVN